MTKGRLILICGGSGNGRTAKLAVEQNRGNEGEAVCRGTVEDGEEDVMEADGFRGLRSAHHRRGNIRGILVETIY